MVQIEDTFAKLPQKREGEEDESNEENESEAEEEEEDELPIDEIEAYQRAHAYVEEDDYLGLGDLDLLNFECNLVVQHI